ncbi:unnamed protein product [Lathyrus sativus]|nr:unnamed protein product [Lathyrus sativus]
MGYALNQPTFHYYRFVISMANVDDLRWVDNIPAEKRTGAFDRGRRWGLMTTNLVESLNVVFKDNCLKVMKEETTKSSTHQVRIFDYTNNVFSVKETMDHGERKPMGHYKVNLLNG